MGYEVVIIFLMNDVRAKTIRLIKDIPPCQGHPLDKTHEIKICIECFSCSGQKPQWFSYKEWSEKKYCSPSCATSHRNKQGLFGFQNGNVYGRNFSRAEGRNIDLNGYKYKNEKQKHLLEHRVVMENEIKRCLKQSEIVHHWDEIKTNNNISNLAVLRRGAHNRLHAFAKRHKIRVDSLKFPQPWLYAIQT